MKFKEKEPKNLFIYIYSKMGVLKIRILKNYLKMRVLKIKFENWNFEKLFEIKFENWNFEELFENLSCLKKII